MEGTIPDQQRLLLLSNSTNAGEEWLEYAEAHIKLFLGHLVTQVLFIPYAGVTFSFDDYAEKAETKFQCMGYELDAIHRADDPLTAVQEAQAIVVGGGNTFHLVNYLHRTQLIEAVRERVRSGIPYIGWSAGANVACPTMKTTNDMPVVQPPSFSTFNLVPFQINPHYLDANPEGHKGETREQRILEFVEVNPDVYAVGLREGTLLRMENRRLELVGEKSMRVFRRGDDPFEIDPGASLEFLLGTL